MMSLSWREAWQNMLAAKLRSALAVLGILVGTASVVAMVSSGQLATHEALRQFKTLGIDLMAVSISTIDEQGKQQLDLLDSQALASLQHIPNVLQFAPYTELYLPTYFNDNEINTTVLGASSTLANLIAIRMQRGRFISDLDAEQLFCVLGQDVYAEIKKRTGQDPLYKPLQIGEEIYRVIGIAAPWLENGFFYQNINRSVIVPLAAIQAVNQYAQIRQIIFKLTPQATIDETQVQISAELAKRIPATKLFFQSAKQLVAKMQKQSHIFTLLLGLIGSISLIVGGIGVMNIMLVSVVERKREIGLRKALGARSRDIQQLFLIEAICLSLVGGVLGVLLGVVTAWVAARLAGWEFSLFLLPMAIGLLVSVAVGVFFGFYPAYKAAQSDPMVCLRRE